MQQKINASTRFATMALDHVIMSVISMIFFIPNMFASFSHAFTVTHEQISTWDFKISYFALIGITLYFCKDCFNGRSIAKRMLKLQVVDFKTGQVASPLQCLVRDLFCIIWPVEMIVALVNPSRRLGDYVAKTKLVYFDSVLVQPEFNIKKITLAFALSYGLMIAISIPINEYLSKFDEPKINFMENSFNAQLSKETNQLFTDSLAQILTTDCRIYDKIDNENLKYISIIFHLKNNDLNNDSVFKQLATETKKRLFAKFPERSFVGKLQYVYQTTGFTTIRFIFLDRRAKKPMNHTLSLLNLLFK